MLRLIGSQFRKPSGLLGRIISKIMIKGNRHEYDKVISELDIQENDRILEIGFGPGRGVDRIASKYDCFVSGIDFSELMFKMAKKRNRKHIENKKVELFHGDFLCSAIIPNQYDKIFCLNVIYFWDKLDEPFSRIKTMLKEDGLLCLFMAHSEYLKKINFAKDDIFNKYSIDQVVDELKSAGFQEITYQFDKGYIVTCIK